MTRTRDRGPSSSRARAVDTPEPPEIDRDGAAVALRLAIAKDGLGIELARKATIACLDVVELVVRLPRVRFPFDVTGGVAKFRHRRGELERLALEIDARRAARWAEPQLRGLIGTGSCVVTISPRAFGATLTISASAAALAFEMAFLATPELALIVHTARGANLHAPATLLAMRAVSSLLGDVAHREGSRFLFPRLAERLARLLLPDAGVRAPSGRDVVLVGSGESDGVLFIAFQRGPSQLATPPLVTTLANEGALITRAADDARFSGDLERARHLDLSSLERAPRHAEVSRRIAEVDACAGGRAEAAIATLRAADRASYLGRLLGDLLVETGDIAGGIAALLREGERDPSPAVAALAYAGAAALATDPTDALTWLDAAVARAPNLTPPRWERASRRLVQGRLADARADFQELEAMASGAASRWEALCRAANIHRTHGLAADAALLYERALLYRPDDPDAVAGLGAAIATEGRAPRGATLLARAIDIANTSVPPRPTAWIELELARVLGELLGDRPAAIARLRSISDDAQEATEARGLEGRYRAALGDTAGASLAFARLRERAQHEVRAVRWLEEAAQFEEGRGELALAQGHLRAAMLAVSGDPIDGVPRRPGAAEIEARYRALSVRIGRAAGVRTSSTPVQVFPKGTPSEPHEYSTIPAPTSLPRPPEAEPSGEAEGSEDDETRIEALTRSLQGDPTNDAVVDELVVRLTRLGRSMELLALLSARLEDAPPERRSELLPRHRDVLERLEREARDSGRDGEADLFKMAREAS